MKTAINLFDLDEINTRGTGLNMVAVLLHDFVSDDPPHHEMRKGELDSIGVILDGPAAQDEQRVNALVDLLQTVIGPRKMGRRVRCYREGPKGGWSEITQPSILRIHKERSVK